MRVNILQLGEVLLGNLAEYAERGLLSLPIFNTFSEFM